MKHSKLIIILTWDFFEQARPAVFQMQKTRQGPSGPVKKKINAVNNN